MSDEDDFWGKPVYTYTRTMAIEDGVLADLCAIAPDICNQIYPGIAIAVTEALWRLIEKAVASPKHHNDLLGVVWDILWMSREPVVQAIAKKETETLFRVIITGTGKQRTHMLKVMLSVADDGETPALTYMFPEED